jgi:hypothetical protein
MTKTTKRMQLWIENPKCFVCGKNIEFFSDATIEHIIPRSKGGTNHLNNLAVSHRLCNELKGSLTGPHEWKKKLRHHSHIVHMKLWKEPRSDQYLLMLIKLSLEDVDFFSKILIHFPQLTEEKQFPKMDLELHTHQIKFLRSIPNIESLIESSKRIDMLKTQSYWRFIFGLLFIEKYFATNSLVALLHGVWRLESYIKRGESSLLTKYSISLLKQCQECEPEAYGAWVESSNMTVQKFSILIYDRLFDSDLN